MSPVQTLVLALGLIVVGAAHAEVSREQAAAMAQRQTGGRVLSVERADAGHGVDWRVKVVTPRGEVRVLLIDGGGDRDTGRSSAGSGNGSNIGHDRGGRRGRGG